MHLKWQKKWFLNRLDREVLKTQIKNIRRQKRQLGLLTTVQELVALWEVKIKLHFHFRFESVSVFPLWKDDSTLWVWKGVCVQEAVTEKRKQKNKKKACCTTMKLNIRGLEEFVIQCVCEKQKHTAIMRDTQMRTRITNEQQLVARMAPYSQKCRNYTTDPASK